VTATDLKTHWKFHWLTRWEEIWDEGFVRQWQAWLDESPSAHVFFHPAMVKAWMETYLPLRDLLPCFLIAESAAHIVFFPLVFWRRNWKNAFQKLLIPVGYSDYDYHDPIVVGLKTEESIGMNSFWADFIVELQRVSGQIYFDRLILDGIRQLVAGEGKSWTPGDTCPWADLRPFERPEAFLPSLKTSLRGDLRRQERRINEVGKLAYNVFTRGMIEQALQELHPFLAAHARRWPAAYKPPHLHENIVVRSMEAGLLHFSTLKIGDESAAWHLGFVFRDRYYYYLPAQEEQFERLSPGKVLLLKCIEQAIINRLSIYDFLRGEESYKAGWTDNTEQLFNLKLDNKKMLSKNRNAIVDRIRPMLMKGIMFDKGRL